MSNNENCFSGKQQLMLHSLRNYYKNNSAIAQMLPIIEGGSSNIISLRLLEWFVTNYSKKNNTFYTITDNSGKMSHFFVYMNYKLQLKAYSKKQFDPFCRRNRIKFYYTDDKYIVTTIGQLNFFRWAINQQIIQYVENNKEDIEMDMNRAIKLAYGGSQSSSLSTSLSSSTSDGTRKKRRELSESATKKINKTNVKIVISFD